MNPERDRRLLFDLACFREEARAVRQEAGYREDPQWLSTELARLAADARRHFASLRAQPRPTDAN